jgi:hypothetical protein
MKALLPSSVRGSTLVVVIVAILVVSALVGAALTVTTANARMENHSTVRAQEIAYADGVMEMLYDQWRYAFSTSTTTSDRTNGLSNSELASILSAPNSTQLPVPPNVVLVSWSVQAADPMLNALTGTTATPTPESGTKSSTLQRLNYLATVQITSTSPGSPETYTLQRNFVRGGTNLFQNFYFGTQPNAEFHPGPNMYISGTVYIGGNLYTATSGMHFLQDVTFTGSMTLNYRSNDPRYGITAPTINPATGGNWNLQDPPHVGSAQKLFDFPMSSLDPNFTDDPISNDVDSDGNPNNDGYHELIETAVAGHSDPLQLDPLLSERLVTSADYQIYVNATNGLTIYKGTSTTPLTATSPDYIALNSALTTNMALYDPRQGDNVRLVSVNVGTLTTAYAGGQITDNNGGNDGLTLYIQDISAGTSVSTTLGGSPVTSNSNRAVMLTNGGNLPYNATNGTGFSVVTPNPVYIQGDYNSGYTGSTQPASNTATATYNPPTVNPSPVVSGYTRAPAAVAADSINILSNAWSNTNSTSSGPNGNGPQATNTTVNAALIGGTVPTTTGSYSGGTENFTRFLEDWSGAYFTLYGCLAPLYDSEQAKGTWSSARYSPPTRCWYYDTILEDNNPPGFRVAQTYQRGIRLVR